MTPCEQEKNIANIAHTLERMEKTQDKLIDLLEKVAIQDTRLDHQEEHSENFYRDINNLFDRVREVELNQAVYGPENKLRLNEAMDEVSAKLDTINTKFERLLSFYKLSTSKHAMYGYGAILALILIGSASDIVNHWDWLKSVWHFYKG